MFLNLLLLSASFCHISYTYRMIMSTSIPPGYISKHPHQKNTHKNISWDGESRNSKITETWILSSRPSLVMFKMAETKHSDNLSIIIIPRTASPPNNIFGHTHVFLWLHIPLHQTFYRPSHIFIWLYFPSNQDNIQMDVGLIG